MNNLNHVAFIMDGNGRWGKNKKRGRNYGHIQGVKTVEKVVQSSLKLKIPIITFYVFSTENWKRPKGEINFLFNLIASYFKKEIKNVVKNGIKINILGDTLSFSKSLKKILNDTIKKTAKNKKLIVNLALNYGSKNEIKNALIKLNKNYSKVTESKISKNLYTSKLPQHEIA